MHRFQLKKDPDIYQGLFMLEFRAIDCREIFLITSLHAKLQ